MNPPVGTLPAWRWLVPIQSRYQALWCAGLIAVLSLGVRHYAPPGLRAGLIAAGILGLYPSLLSVMPGIWIVASPRPAQMALILSDHLQALGYHPVAAAMPRVLYRSRKPWLALWPEGDIRIERECDALVLSGPVQVLRRVARRSP